MANLRVALAIAIPALVTTVIGLFWIFIRKRDDDPDIDADESTRKTQRSNDNILPNTDNGNCIYAEQNVSSDQKTVESNCEQIVSKATADVLDPTDVTVDDQGITDVLDPTDVTVDDQGITDVLDPTDVTVDDQGITDVLDPTDVTVDDQGIVELNKNGNANSSYLETNSSSIDSLAKDISEKGIASAIVQYCDEKNAESLSCVTDSESIKQSLLRDDDISGTAVDLNRSTRVISNSDSGIDMPSPDTHAPKDITTSHESKELKRSEDNMSLHEDLTTNVPTLSWSELSACENDDASNVCNGSHDDPDTAVYWNIMKEHSNNSMSQNHPSNHRKTVPEDISIVDESIIASAVADSCSSTPSVFYDNHVQNNSEQLAVSHTVNSCHESQNGAVRESRTPSGQLSEHSTIGSEASSCDNNSEASNDSGKGASVSENNNNNLPQLIQYEVDIPNDLCGLLIGKMGKNINHIKEMSGSNLTLRNNPYRSDYQSCVIEGLQNEVDRALELIRKKFPESKFPEVDLSPTNNTQIVTPVDPQNQVIMPDVMQLNLPDGVSIDVVVSSIVNAGHVFIQQPTHPTFPSLERLNQVMISCYIQDGIVPQLPRPIEVGVICAAPMLNGWYRAQIMSVCEETGECDIKYVDYGGYARINAAVLRQIRSDFMTLPFQAVECYLGNITPLEGETFFGTEASSVLEELTQGRLLQAQVVSHTDDNMPCIHIYQVMGNKALFVNRELINRSVVRWIDLLT